jgi:membrane protease YdiL (CAAX protease family)
VVKIKAYVKALSPKYKMKNKQQLIVAGGYYVLAILVVMFFYREDGVSSDFVQMICAVLFLFILPVLLIKKAFSEDIRKYGWPVDYVKKQLLLSVIIVWGISLLIWGFMIQWGGEVGRVVWKSNGVTNLMLKNLVVLPIGLLAQEFFFRGFLLRIFKDSFGRLFTIVVVAVLAGIFSMILARDIFDWKVMAGIFVTNSALGWWVLKFKSVIFSFFGYWLVVTLLNLYVIYQFSQGVK